MFLKKIGLFLILFLLNITTLSAAASHNSFISPLSLGISETDSIFRNPAELTFYRNLADLKLHYVPNENKFGGLVVLHFPDNFPFYIEDKITKSNLGHFAFSTEFFGTDFSNNITLIDNKEGGAEFTLANGGFRTALTWAKRTRFLTIGLNAKYFNYRTLQYPNSKRDALGLDAGVYFSPFTDLFLGIVVNDVGNTTIKDNKNVTIEKVPQSLLLTGALLSGHDFSLSIGVPLDVIKSLDDSPKKSLQLVSFQGKKIFDDLLEVVGGYSNKKLYASLGLSITPYISLGLTTVKPAVISTLSSLKDVDLSVSMTLGFPVDEANKNMRNSNYNKGRGWGQHKKPSRSIRKSRNEKRKKMRKNRRKKKRQESRRGIEKDLINEIDDEIDRLKIKRLKRKKRAYQRLKREEKSKDVDKEDDTNINEQRIQNFDN